jgi:NADH dehydrogenase/NADH:ubiquinone oxidoreductase subunit G
MGKQLNLLRQRKAAAMTDLTEDQNWLNNTIAQEYGITFTFDQNDGTISNYYEVMDQLHQELRDAEIRAGETLDKESEQEEIDAINEKISALQGAIDIYEATRQEINETDTAIKDMIRSIQEANLEDLNLKLEFEIIVDDSQLEKLDYYLGKVSDNIWGMAEAAALMTGKNADLFGFDMG